MAVLPKKPVALFGLKPTKLSATAPNRRRPAHTGH
jgi:hypothetical protein